MKQFNATRVIILAAVITGAPRWITALLAAEGLMLPETWDEWWLIMSVIMGGAMAVLEALSFESVAAAVRNPASQGARVSIFLALLSGGTFIAIMPPSVMASVRKIPLNEILSSDWQLALWSIAISASTILIVATVGYSQQHPDDAKPNGTDETKPIPPS